MYPEINSFLKESFSRFDRISADRRQLLNAVTDYIRQKFEGKQPCKLVFICTHNSRRSHLGQIWTLLAANYFQVETLIETYSGGTEETAPHVNMINALKSAGLRVFAHDKQPLIYSLKFSDDAEAIPCFSKLYDDPANPANHFAAIMTCSEADQNCPFIPGAEKRFALPYEDPKVADGTSQAGEVYQASSREIATEMMFIFNQVKQNA